MKKFILFASVVIVLVLVAALVFLKGKGHEIRITEQQIDAKLAEMFPAEKTYFAIFHLTLTNPEVTLLPESDRIQVELAAILNLRIPGQSRDLGGMLLVTSGIRYDHEEKAVFLTDPVIEKIQIEGVPQKHLEKVSAVATKAAGDFLISQPIYRLEGTDAKTTAAKLLLKNVEVKEQEIVLSLGI